MRKQNPEWLVYWCAESTVRWSRRAIQQSAFIRRDVANYTNHDQKRTQWKPMATGCTVAKPARRAVSDRLNPPASTRQTPTHPATDRGLVPARLAVGAPLHSWTDPPTSRFQADLNSTLLALLQMQSTRFWSHPKSLKPECKRAQGGVCVLP